MTTSILYGATTEPGAGALYILDPNNGSVISNIGLTDDSGGNNYSITGLAFHPFTGVLYGAVGNNSDTNPGFLVTIDPATALVTPIGDFQLSRSVGDLAFDASGTLYGLDNLNADLYRIDLNTGLATLVGPSDVIGVPAGLGLAVSASQTFYGTPTTNTFGTYNQITGLYTNIADPVPKPEGTSTAINSLDFNFDGTLFGVNIAQGTFRTTSLITIDLVTGAITNIGSTDLLRLDAIAFRIIPFICIHPLMMVSTFDGQIKLIKDVKPGDVLMTQNPNKPAKVIVNYRNTSPHNVLVKLDKDAIAQNVPNQPLLVTSNHPIVIDGKYVKPRHLINGNTIGRIKETVNTHTLITNTGKAVMIHGVPVGTWTMKKWLAHVDCTLSRNFL
jgi:hypothetical protein